MQMGMMMEVLAPGVQHCQEANLCSQPLGVGRHFEQGLGGRPKKEPVHETRVLQRQGGDGVGNCEHDMKVRHLQQFVGAVPHPLGGDGPLALRAMTIAAGVVSDSLVRAMIAACDMPTQGGRPAAREVFQDPSLGGGRAMAREKLRPMCAHDVGHFQRFVLAVRGTHDGCSAWGDSSGAGPRS